jgi:hypothetical protein
MQYMNMAHLSLTGFSSLPNALVFPYYIPDRNHAPCSAELISTAYQPWNSIFLSQQINHSRFISQKNSLPNRAMARGMLSQSINL